MYRFSFLLPTRQRPALVQRFLESVQQTARWPDQIEVVLCVDEDDPESQAIRFDGLALRHVVVAPGATMGSLNRACFAAASGRFVMLINDDVVARTRHWDREIYAAFDALGDDVGLIHTNDLLFREKLCTFPILSKAACDAIGVCPAEYRRYRIDDHIYDTYRHLAYLGHRRVVYLPDVVFEHLNHQADVDEGTTHSFRSDDAKVYQPDQGIIAVDAELFDARSDDRLAEALALARLIERLSAERKADGYERKLRTPADVRRFREDPVVRTSVRSQRPAVADVSVTIGVVTSSIAKPHATECLARIRQHTRRCDLVILDNNGSADFNHPREMNRVLDLARSDFVVLMDDDVMVEEGWLEALLGSVDQDTGVVGPLHKDAHGTMSHSGVYLAGDEWGSHGHLVDVPAQPRVAQCLCSASLLIDRRKCGHVRFSEGYAKYFLDLDYSLKIWESGFKVTCSPATVVTHLAGATLPHGSPASLGLWNRDIEVFRTDWLLSGRLERLQRQEMTRYPFLLLLYSTPRRIIALLNEENWEVSDFHQTLERLVDTCKPFPLFQGLLVRELRSAAARATARGDRLKEGICQEMLGRLEGVPVLVGGPAPILLEAHRGYNVVAYAGEVLAIPRSLGALDVRVAEERKRPGIVTAPTAAAVKFAVDSLRPPVASASTAAAAVPAPQRQEPAHLRPRSDGEPRPTPPAPAMPAAFAEAPALVIEGYRHFNIVRWNGRFYGVPQGEGAFEPEAISTRRYSSLVIGDRVSDVQRQIDRSFSPLLRRAARKVKQALSR